MERYYLTEITTKDNLIHQGIYYQPKNKSDVAILWVHGLTGNFYNDIGIFDQLIQNTNKLGYGFASFNNRGHDMITEISKIDRNKPKGKTHITGGAGCEKFTDCIFDIDSGISFLIKQGFKKVILIGHSTGANKVCYYAGSHNDPRVAGVILASAISDRYTPYGNKPWLTKVLLQALQVIGLGNVLFPGFNFFPVTPNRALSLITHSVEDVFDYGEKSPQMKIYQQINIPLFNLWGENDEYADRPVVQIKSVFDKYTKSKKYQSIIIPKSFHGFEGKESVFAKIIIDWIERI